MKWGRLWEITLCSISKHFVISFYDIFLYYGFVIRAFNVFECHQYKFKYFRAWELYILFLIPKKLYDICFI